MRATSPAMLAMTTAAKPSFTMAFTMAFAMAFAMASSSCGTQALAPSAHPPAVAPPVRPPAEAAFEVVSPGAPPAPKLMSSAELDVLVAELWQAGDLLPAPVADDSEFLRRVTLDVAGRIPTLDEVELFLASPAAPDKRVRLVDQLLSSRDHAEHWGDLYLDLFVGRQFRKPRLEKALDPRSYFVSAFLENRRFDVTARELLTFAGEILPNGPGVFLASHLKGGGPETAASVTSRLFLGVQLQCAQCHDHPYDARYKQEDFFGLVAYFARTKDREQRPDRQRTPQAERDTSAESVGGGMLMAPAAPPLAAAGAASPPSDGSPVPDPKDAERMYFVIDKPRGQAKFKKAGSEQEIIVPPRFFGRDVPPLPDERPRQTLARAVVGSDLFAKTVVDRTWAQLFGRGIVEPWDDLGGEDDPRHPPLLNRLAADFRASGFDMRHLLRTLLLSRAYALTSRAAPLVAPAASPTAPPAAADVKDHGAPDAVSAAFARAAVRRLTPEQLFRSMLIATGVAHMERAGAADLEKKIDRQLRECLFVFGDDEMAEVNTFNGNIPQALFLWNGEIVNQGARSRPGGTLARILGETRDPELRLRRMFLSTYARPPSETERLRMVPRLTAAGSSPVAYEDLFFALLTSSEMLTIH